MIGQSRAQRLCLAVCLVLMPATVAAQTEYAAIFHEPFTGKPANAQDFALLGPDAAQCVKFERDGLRITLPAGWAGERPRTGLATGFGVKGDFEITVAFESLQEPDQAKDIGQSRFTLAVALNKPDGARNFRASHNRRWTKAGPHFLTWFVLPGKSPETHKERADAYPVQTKAKTGRLRLVRRGADLSYFAAEGADEEFSLLQKYAFSAEDLREVSISASTGSPQAALAVRVTDLLIRAAAFPRGLPESKPVVAPLAPRVEVTPLPAIPTKAYAQTYDQSFKGSGANPAGWNYTSRLAEQCIKFEDAGLRITMPPGQPGGAGISSAFNVRGDFEITLSFEVLKDPDPADVGKSGTRLTLAATLDTEFLDTPKQEGATLSRSMATKGFFVWMRNRDRPDPASQPFPTPAMTGRLRLVRSGDALFFLASIGVDGPFTFLKRYRFGSDDLKRVAITCATGGEKASLDVRVSDFQIRADAIPGAPAPGVPDAQPIAAPAPGGGVRGKLVIALFLAISIGVVLALGFLWRRRGDGRGLSA